MEKLNRKFNKGRLGLVILFSLIFNYSNAATYYVINNNDAGTGSLRQAILDANSNSVAPHTISFSSFTGSSNILLDSQTLPSIKYPTSIDGTTHPNYSNTPIITIDGTDLTNSNSNYFHGYSNMKVFTFESTAINSKIIGLRIQDNSPLPLNGTTGDGVIGVQVNNVSGIEISNNEFLSTDQGVSLLGGNSQVLNNSFSGNTNSIYMLFDCNGALIKGNKILNTVGPSIYARASNSTIKENYISGSLERYGILIINTGLWGDARNNLVANNEINVIGKGIGVYAALADGTSGDAKYNRLKENLIYNVNQLAIDLGYNSTNPGNEAKAIPVISTALSTGEVTGTANPGDIIEVFGGNGTQEAQEYLGTTITDATGSWIINSGSNITYSHVTATATDPIGTNGSLLENTSQLANLPVTLIVQNISEPCETCIGSFSPEAGQRYVIGAWSKEANAPLTKTTYDQPVLNVTFTVDDGSGNVSTVTAGPFLPSGNIIDGWQRIEEEFDIPAGAIDIQIELTTASGGSVDVYFDDIRIFPFDASMKTYVYDPINMRLAAELDERHYATFYEYNEEGQLVRIKKETEKGIMTIQETKSNSVKK